MVLRDAGFTGSFLWQAPGIAPMFNSAQSRKECSFRKTRVTLDQ